MFFDLNLIKDEIYQYLGDLIIPVIILGAVLWFILQRKIEQEVQNSINLYKTDIEFKYSRKIENHKLSIDKKHFVYSDSSERITKTHSLIVGLEGLKSRPNLREFNNEDFVIFLEKNNFTAKIIEKFAKDFQDGTLNEIDFFRYLSFLERQEVRKVFNETKSFFWLKKIYFSQDLSEKSKSLIDKLGELLLIIEFPIPNSKNHQHKDSLKRETLMIIDELIDYMRRELSSEN